MVSRPASVAALAAATALAACQAPLGGGQGAADLAVTNVALVDSGTFVVPGEPGAGNWCLAGVYAASVLRQPAGTRLTRISDIGPAGVDLGATRVPGPGVLYSSRDDTIFDTLAGVLRESRTVRQAQNSCRRAL